MSVPDSMDVRLELVRQVKAGEISLKAAQAKLRSITRKAKDAGKLTYFEARRRGA